MSASSAEMRHALGGVRQVGMLRRMRRWGRALFGRALLAVWVVLPLFPLLGAAFSWWAGVR